MTTVPKMQSLPGNVKKVLLDRHNDLEGARKPSVDPIFFNHITYENQLALVYPNNTIYGYSPSGSDALADDWVILDTDEEILHTFEDQAIINTFGDAVKALKAGKSIARDGWNASGMFVYLVKAAEYKSLTQAAIAKFGDKTPYRQYMALKTAQNDVATWCPSSTDVLSTDWVIL